MPLAAVATLLLTAGAAFFVGGLGRKPAEQTADVEQTGSGCAVVSQVHGDTGLSTGEILKPGALRIPGGLARIEFFSGAIVLLEGGAELEIVSAWKANFGKDKIRVSVPPPAEGFRISTPGMELIDIGTEFAVSSDDNGATEVHVFEGEVEAYPEGKPMTLLTEGKSLRSDGVSISPARPADFVNASQLDEMASSTNRNRFQEWKTFSENFRNDPRLIAYYTFEETGGWSRAVENLAASDGKRRSGAAVGAKRTKGRWPSKGALEFKGRATASGLTSETKATTRSRWRAGCGWTVLTGNTTPCS